MPIIGTEKQYGQHVQSQYIKSLHASQPEVSLAIRKYLNIMCNRVLEQIPKEKVIISSEGCQRDIQTVW